MAVRAALFSLPHTHLLSCVWVCCRMMFCLIFLFLLGYFPFIFSLFYFHVQLRHAMIRQRWLHASWYSCLYVLFTNYNSRTISETRLTREASIAWLSILLHKFSFLSIRCCRILSNLLLFLLLLQREYYCRHHHIYHRRFVFQRTHRSGHVLPPLPIRPAHIRTSFGWQLLNNPRFNLKFLIPKFQTDASWQQQTCFAYSSVCVCVCHLVISSSAVRCKQFPHTKLNQLVTIFTLMFVLLLSFRGIGQHASPIVLYEPSVLCYEFALCAHSLYSYNSPVTWPFLLCSL